MDVFSKSEREDDEKALKCVAIERVLKRACFRRSVETKDEGKEKEIETMQLELVEKRDLLERLVKIAEEDNENFLLKIRERMDRYIISYLDSILISFYLMEFIWENRIIYD